MFFLVSPLQTCVGGEEKIQQKKIIRMIFHTSFIPKTIRIDENKERKKQLRYQKIHA
jgi:hypothetical protein